jgi:signal transduction histidine kinase
MRRKVGKSLKYIMLLLLAVLIPMVANALMLIGVLPNKGLDITSQVLLLSFIFFGVAVYQQKFLNLYPVAARHFIETMPDGIIILDKENLVIGVNGAVNNLFPGLGLKIYDKSIKIIDYIRENDEEGFSPVLALALQDASTQLTEKVKLKIHDMVITVELMTLAGFHQTPTGKIVILENVTEEQQLLDEIQKKNLLLTKSNIRLTHSNNMLMSANNRLEKLSQTIEELAVMKERNRVGREVHDTVGAI